MLAIDDVLAALQHAIAPFVGTVIGLYDVLLAPLLPDFTEPLLGTPGWMWLAFFSVVVVVLAFDLGILHRERREIGARESLLMSSLYIVVALVFGGWLWWLRGADTGMDYLTGFVIEKSLAMDNIFVIAMIFGYLAIPRASQHRVLFWGIIGVIVLRALMIGLGAALISRFDWVLYIFGAFLVFTGIRMLMAGEQQPSIENNPVLKLVQRRLRVTEDLEGDRFLVRRPDASGREVLWCTPLFVALLMVETADIVFAVDSVPAIFAITQDPFVVYTSNIFAILGLRALYFALAAMMHRFHYLKYALALVLVVVGGKIFLVNIVGKIPPVYSLTTTLSILAAGVLFSLWRTGGRSVDPLPAGR